MFFNKNHFSETSFLSLKKLGLIKLVSSRDKTSPSVFGKSNI